MAENLIGGIDEVGRGCLAGPIVAVVAVFDGGDSPSLPPAPLPGLKDSKAFSNDEVRKEVFHSILRSPYLLDFGIGCIGVDEIDEVGIDEANARAFCDAVKDLKNLPNTIYVDGINPVRNFPRSHQIIKPRADGLHWPVSAASIIAKTIRDELMAELHVDYPEYHWADNSGYGTAFHIEVLKDLGPTPHHRKLFIKRTMENR